MKSLIWLVQPSKGFHRNQLQDALECLNLTLGSYRWPFAVRRVKNATSSCWILLELHSVGNIIPENAFVFSLALQSPFICGFLCHLCVKMLKQKGQGSAVTLIQSQNETQECQGFLWCLSKKEVSHSADDNHSTRTSKSLWEELSRYSISFQPFPPKPPLKPKPNHNKKIKPKNSPQENTQTPK